MQIERCCGLIESREETSTYQSKIPSWHRLYSACPSLESMGLARRFRWASSTSSLKVSRSMLVLSWVKTSFTGWSNSLSRHVLRLEHCGMDQMLLVSVLPPMMPCPHHRWLLLSQWQTDRLHQQWVWRFDSTYYQDPSLHVTSCRAKTIAMNRKFGESRPLLLHLRTLLWTFSYLCYDRVWPGVCPIRISEL